MWCDVSNLRFQGPILGLCEICIVDLGFRDSQSHTLRYMKNTFLLTFFIIFSSFCIFVPLPLAAPASSLFLYFFFIFPSFLGRWGLEAEARLFILFSFFHVFFIFPSFALEVRAKREGGGGQKRGAFSFYFHFFFILFSLIHFIFMYSSNFFFILFSFFSSLLQ